MKVLPKKIYRKYQTGGEMATADTTGAEEQNVAPEEQTANPEQATQQQGGQQDPLMMLAQMAAQAIQNNDCQMAMQVCQVFLQILQQASGQNAQQASGQPVFRKGGTLVRRIKK